MYQIPFQKIPWSSLPKIEHPGEEGKATWQTLQFAGLCIRKVEYSPGYLADHWCEKGHVVHCLEGSFTTELKTGDQFHFIKGESFAVSDDMSAHRIFSAEGVKLLIIDGDFLKNV